MNSRLVVAFDLDNTLMDPDMRAYDGAVRGLLAAIDCGLPNDAALETFEFARAAGHALERIGLRNAVHERGNPDGLAVFLLIACENPRLRAEFHIPADRLESNRLLLARLSELQFVTRHGTISSRLEAELRFRRFQTSDTTWTQMRDDVRRLSEHPRILEWSRLYQRLERDAAVDHHLPMLESLARRGASCVVLSEGRSAIQREKLARLGLTEFFKHRVLITEDAERIPGLVELDARLDPLLAECAASFDGEAIGATAWHHPPGANAVREREFVPFLWHIRCMIDLWSWKTPSFFARCLHAIQADPENPEAALRGASPAADSKWSENPLRFVMIGDRYDKDIRPIIDLIGPRVGMTIRLQAGKYATLDPADSLPATLRPSRTVSDLRSLRRLLHKEFHEDEIHPISAAPPIFEASAMSREFLDVACSSEWRAVRCVADMFRAGLQPPGGANHKSSSDPVRHARGNSIS